LGFDPDTQPAQGMPINTPGANQPNNTNSKAVRIQEEARLRAVAADAASRQAKLSCDLRLLPDSRAVLIGSSSSPSKFSSGFGKTFADALDSTTSRYVLARATYLQEIPQVLSDPDRSAAARRWSYARAAQWCGTNGRNDGMRVPAPITDLKEGVNRLDVEAIEVAWSLAKAAPSAALGGGCDASIRTMVK